jgi:hypothetical protein
VSLTRSASTSPAQSSLAELGRHPTKIGGPSVAREPEQDLESLDLKVIRHEPTLHAH